MILLNSFEFSSSSSDFSNDFLGDISHPSFSTFIYSKEMNFYILDFGNDIYCGN